MKYLVIFTTLFAVAVGRSVHGDGRIIGGEDAKPGDAPHLGSLRVNGIHNCGCNIISDRWAVTAAHCLGYSPSILTIVFGSIYLNNTHVNSAKEYEVEKTVAHEKHNPWLFENDIGLVKTVKPIEFTKFINAIIVYPEYLEADKLVTTFGFGSEELGGPSANTLQTLKQKTLSNEQCQEELGIPMNPGHICAKSKCGEGMCHGDSGSCLIYNGACVGVVSFGRPCAVCYPDAFTRLFEYIGWMKDTMNNN